MARFWAGTWSYHSDYLYYYYYDCYCNNYNYYCYYYYYWQGVGDQRCELEVGDSHNFPQSDARCNFSHELAGQKAGSQGCQRHGEEGRGRPDLTLFPFYQGFHPIVSRSPACQHLS